MNLNYLINPIENFDEYFQKKPFYINKNNIDKFSDLFTIEDVENLFLKADILQLIKCRKIRFVKDNIGYLVDEFSFHDLYSKIALDNISIIFNNIESFNKKVYDLILNLKKTFCCQVMSNLYLTPPFSSAFNFHYDTHEVLVLQLYGKKEWIVKGPKIDTPKPNLEKSNFVDENYTSNINHNIILNQGEVLYIPSGWVHAASTKNIDSASLHLSIGIHTSYGFNYKHLLKSFLETLENDLNFGDLRKSLPIGNFNLVDNNLELKNIDKNKIKKNILTIFNNIDYNEENLYKNYQSYFNEQFNNPNILYPSLNSVNGHMSYIFNLNKINENTMIFLRNGILYNFSDEMFNLQLPGDDKYVSIRYTDSVQQLIELLEKNNTYQVKNLNFENKIKIIKECVINGFIQYSN